MTDPRTQALEAAAVAATAKEFAGGNRVAEELLKAKLRANEAGEIVAPGGQSPETYVESLKADPDFSALFPNGTAEQTSPSWEGKKFSEMTQAEQIEYTNAQAEAGAYSPWFKGS